MENNKVIVLIGDIVNSRKIENRVDFDNRLSSLLEKISDEKKGIIISRFTMIGDEIQAVYNTAEHLFTDAVRIQALAHPNKMRFSWGIGTLSKPVNYHQTIEMDGPAFHQAREGIQLLKKNEKLFTFQSETDSDSSTLLREILHYLSHQTEDWNKNRWEILARYLQNQDAGQIARGIGISGSAVYKNLNQADIDTIKNIFHHLEKLINKLIKGG